MPTIHITMLGGFSIEANGHSVDDSLNRMKKVWLLLAYLICCRSSGTSQEALLSLLQGGSDESADPGGRIKTMFHRARTMLNQLGENFGHTLILNQGGNYLWNTEIPLQLDVEQFEQLCTSASRESGKDARLALYLQALELYRGDFLPKLSAEPWVIPISAYYHQMYLSAAEEALALLEQDSRWDDCIRLCQQALKIEPYSEAVYQALMRSQLALELRSAALHTYEEMCELLFSAFGVMPSDESRRLYRLAARETEGSAIPAGTVREQLREPAGTKGAMVCEYDFFRLLYRVQARSLPRSGDTIHIALLSLHGQNGKELPRRSLDTAMENLQDLIVHALRQGDVISKCSVSQLIIMLPQANYENSCAVCQRILRAFHRQYPHSPAQIRFSVQPLEPLTPAEPAPVS